MPRKLYTPEEKASHIQRWRNSGLSQREYCLKYGVGWTTFKNWKKSDKKTTSGATFAQVRVNNVASSSVVIETPQGFRVHINDSQDEIKLRSVLSALGLSDAS